MKLVVGLGNPGPKYAATRHNVGVMVVEAVAKEAGISLKKQGHQGLYGVGRFGGEEVMLLLPQTYMNLSGVSVASACKSLGVALGDLLVVHDDIEIPFGTLRLRSGGGHGGHNGIRSIRDVLGSGDFIRLKVGVGRPPVGGDVAGWVLNPFSPEERRHLEALASHSARAVEVLLSAGVQQAMNQYNNRDFSVV